ncbi:S66 family peptidase [Mycoplasmopsis verecunda]|uniref:Muramoyltetrapeptide carboxypeptidase LdcA (Peptidoglycan recycling) n=1 Tax=Mycoplasmopsis verecunda TaxID=171291 RepID=A0A1T4KY02_9BACT|nr:S66 peptidase family protein [Mycoplasmopsis verecunda]WPB54334.1 LD-carboxypeptidase [Mycoplasmopsis verecunda]SJZ47187.1 Muramoyltetrapeptide carboxypeptidase LdcA (peptidoglycan recycling) [Mycoplasmopsis verecunda]
MLKHCGLISLSSGALGEDFVKHELHLGFQRLSEFGMQTTIMPNSLKGIKHLSNNPQERAQDLIDAFKNDNIDLILCAIGGNDTYKLIPYLFENDRLKKVTKNKVFLGYSDTTVNHFMLYKLGLKTFYGQAFLTDICELSNEMLPYSYKYFNELITTGNIKEIKPSKYWYKERNDFSPNALGTQREIYSNEGFILLQGNPIFQGEILGGCIESIYKNFLNPDSEAYAITNKYQIFPSLEQWKDKILLLETSESKSSPELFATMLHALSQYGIFDVISGVLVGKPQDNIYFNEYQDILKEKLPSNVPIVYNINVGHAYPHCIIPLGKNALVNAINQTIKFDLDK